MKQNPSSKKKHGICYLVGAGPGDPGLFTIRGRECLSRAEVVLYDYLSNQELLRYAPVDAEKIFVGKSARKHALSQEEINALLVKKTQAGHCVVRLKGGDPFLFGRGGEEAQALAEADLSFEIIPGVTSAIGGLAYAGIPVTHRSNNSQLTIFTGHENPSKEVSSLNYKSLAMAPGTKVMLMGVERLDAITASLMDAGMEPATPAALVRWATTGRHETITGTASTIARLAQEKNFSAPAIAVFGEVVLLRKKLNWFETRPLFGRRIVVTRTREQASELVKGLRELGADVYELPTIRIEAIEKKEEKAAFLEVVNYAHAYDWIVFTSPNGVSAFFEEFYQHHHDARALGAARIAAIGPGTEKKIRKYRFSVDLVPPTFVAESLLEEFKKVGVENLRILLPRASGAREFLATALEDLGAIVDDVPVYHTRREIDDKEGGIQRFVQEGADMITFASGSSVEYFDALLKNLGRRLPDHCRTASIGPITSSKMRELGIPISIEAKEHHIPGLLKAVMSFFNKAES